MDIQDLIKKKKAAGMTNQQIADLSGIPVSTVNKIFSGATANPRYATLLAIEEVLAVKKKLPFEYDHLEGQPMILRESVTPYHFKARAYSSQDLDQLSESTRAELIDGKLYLMATPSTMHQWIVTSLTVRISNHILTHHGTCKTFVSPFSVRLNKDDQTLVEPDVLVICNPEIITEHGCDGAPDWIIEVVSQSNASHDYVTKMVLYQKAGVREYWVVNPEERSVLVVNWEDAQKSAKYDYETPVPSGVMEGLLISFDEIEKSL